MKIAIDAMGGDHAPMASVQGTLLAAAQYPDAEFVLVGREPEILSSVAALPKNVSVLHASDVIDAAAEPVKSVRRQKDSSLVVSATMVRDGMADAMVSAGNTGAFMVAGLLVVGRMNGIDRPALAAMLPTFSGNPVLLMDAGANTDCTDTNLLQFAKMGEAYLKVAMGSPHARVGLINIGAEEGKGNDVCKAAYPRLKDVCDEFVGNVEARDLLRGMCDVAVCDGFVGNVLVKFYEGVGVGILDSLKRMFVETLSSKIAALFLRSRLKLFRNRFDYAEYGGGPFLGVRGVLVKAHGSSNARAFHMAISQACRMHTSGLIHALERELSVNQ